MQKERRNASGVFRLIRTAAIGDTKMKGKTDLLIVFAATVRLSFTLK